MDTQTRLNLGCGRDYREGWVNLDSSPNVKTDVLADLECGALAFDDNTFDLILASHILEHIRNLLPLMAELWRITKPGGQLVIATPYGSSDDAWEDPTHVRAFYAGSWNAYSQPYYWRADYGYRGDWQPRTVELQLRAERPQTAIGEAVMFARNVVSQMVATLEAVKPIREPRQELLEYPQVYLVETPRE